MPNNEAQAAGAAGQGTVTRKAQPGPYAAGGIVHGEGTVHHLDGTKTHFTLMSDPLTEDQAQHLNETQGV